MALITVVGNAGVGKSALVRALADAGDFALGLEQHAQRPFHAAFVHALAQGTPRFALANQVDFLLLRAEQERALRQTPRPGLVDGGLDLDYHLFTRRFAQLGYLDADEFALCTRLYITLREMLGPPDLILYLWAPLEVIRRRYAARRRPQEIARPDDLEAMQALVAGWIAGVTAAPVLTVDASRDDFTAPQAIARLLAQIATPAPDGIRASLNFSPSKGLP